MARSRTLPLAALTALAVLPGCVDIPTTDASDESSSVTVETPTSTAAEPIPTNPATPTKTDEWYAGCNATSSVGPADEVPSDATVFDYVNPLTEWRAEFGTAVGELNSAESADVASLSEWIDAYEFWVERLYTKHENETCNSVVAVY